MGGLTSKTFKPRKKSKPDPEPEEEKRSSVAGVEYREKELQLSRETKSAYYYGNKNGVKDDVDKADGAPDDGQKRVVLQNAGSSDHTLFKRVRETPTAIYYEPNDNDDTDKVDAADKAGKKKNIVLENVPVVEKRIKVIRDGSSDITIRPMSITRQKHEMIIDHTVNKKPRDNILNTYSVMVKTKETNAVPTATVTLDDDKGLGAIVEGQERESQLLAEEEKEETRTVDNLEQQSTALDAQKVTMANAEHEKDNQIPASETKEQENVKEKGTENILKKDIDNDSEIKPVDKMENVNVNKQNINDISNTEQVKTENKLEEDLNKLQTVSPKEDNSLQVATDDDDSNKTSVQVTHVLTFVESDKQAAEAEIENAITDIDTGITVVKDTQLNGDV